MDRVGEKQQVRFTILALLICEGSSLPIFLVLLVDNF